VTGDVVVDRAVEAARAVDLVVAVVAAAVAVARRLPRVA